MRITPEEAVELGVADELRRHHAAPERLGLLSRPRPGKAMSAAERQAARRRRDAAIVETLKARCRLLTRYERRALELTGVPLHHLFDAAYGDADPRSGILNDAIARADRPRRAAVTLDDRIDADPR